TDFAELCQIRLALGARFSSPRLHRAFGKGQSAVGNGEIVVNRNGPPETLARRARTERMIETEQSRRRFAVLDVALRAMKTVGKQTRNSECGTRIGNIEFMNRQLAFAEMVALFARLHEAGAIVGRKFDAVLKDREMLDAG